MTPQELTKKFEKKSVPQIKSGDTVRVSFKITEGSKTRIQAFEGLVISVKHGKGLDGSVKIRKISGGVGVERTFPLHSPLISKFEKIKSSNLTRSKLYYVRDLTGKQLRKKATEYKDYAVWEEKEAEEELKKIEEEKAREAEAKAAEKEQEEKELEEKFAQARGENEEAPEAEEESNKEESK